jgi:YHS domain-containing protein
MKFSKVIIFCAVILSLSSCDRLLKGETKSTAPTPKKVVEISIASLSSKTDPVCTMTLKQGEVADTLTYQGKLYGFCGTGCKEEFIKNPGQYLNQ